MSERTDAIQKIIFLNGRIDDCEKVATDLQNRIEYDQCQIARLKGFLDNSPDAKAE